MANRVVLDTNIVIAALRNDAAVLSQLAVVDDVLSPATVIGELFFGAQNSRYPQAERGKLESFLSSFDETASCLAIMRPHWSMVTSSTARTASEDLFPRTTIGLRRWPISTTCRS